MPHQENKQLLDILARCAAECGHCANACLDESDVKMLTRCIRLDIDCADICRLTANFISRGSEHRRRMLDACAVICQSCSEECEKHAHMEHCARCAEACRECANACRSGSLKKAS